MGNTKALRASTVAEAKPVSVGRSVGRSFCWRLHANRVLEKHQAGRRHVGERVILNSPWNTQIDDMRPPVSRQRRYCFTWNNYPLDAEEQLRSLAERKRIVVRGNICVNPRQRRYAILFYFRKLNLHYVLQQKFENDSSSYRKLEDCTLHIVHVLHTLHICDVQP